MQTENHLIDDLVKVINGAAGTFVGMGREAENVLKDRLREWIGGLDFVSRDEFETLKLRVEALEAASKKDKA
ncbi:MAG: accessory factor UbiK family protein [Zymomonas mobilis]|uniref:BMFP domain-containing protein YqiC n=2 Tax=Zymomonas mobilis TaxID=542 RepID=A0A542W249_ZYMMB|nr:accessory factor UbiK family protein [Zymomonas mobilis]TQL17656.1 BMFP domain-containing protein YqiC [Zymomonas mobilis]